MTLLFAILVYFDFTKSNSLPSLISFFFSFLDFPNDCSALCIWLRRNCLSVFFGCELGILEDNEGCYQHCICLVEAS